MVKNKVILLVVGLAMVALLAVATIFYEDLSLNVLLSAIGLYVLFTRVYARKDYPQGNFGRLVGLVSRHSLGIYATHVAVMTVAEVTVHITDVGDFNIDA